MTVLKDGGIAEGYRNDNSKRFPAFETTGLSDLSIAPSTSARDNAAAFWKPWADVVAARTKVGMVN